MDAAAQWPQEIDGVFGKSGSCFSSSSSSLGGLMSMVVSSTSTTRTAASTMRRPPQVIRERRMRPSDERALHCPRCSSTNTKFCYYNNYSLTQPRYFCKTCRRYWTQGGSLRNVPVGGGSRKNKKPTAATAAAAKSTPLPSSSSSPAYVKAQLIDPTPHQDANANANANASANANFQEVKDHIDLAHCYRNVNGVGDGFLCGCAFQETAPDGLGLPSFFSSTVGFPMDASMGEGGVRSMLPFQHLVATNRGQGTIYSSGFCSEHLGNIKSYQIT